MNNQWVWIALGVVLICMIGYVLAYIRVFRPLKRLTNLTNRLDELNADELREQTKRIAGVPGRTARAIAEYVVTSEDRSDINKGKSHATEEQYKIRVVDEICRSLLPQKLKDNASGLSFALSGGILSGVRRNCAFYDHFFLDDNTLCLVVGQVPGSGIAEALFAVVSQTTIRSRLRMNNSLVETMSDVNAQLFDLGGRSSVSVIVCVLNTVNGKLTFVNAGNPIPYLMRNEEDYDILMTPVYAPLGANESVTYRPEVLRLNQGDRLFLYTEDLREMVNRDGEQFGVQEFQSILNRSRSKTHSTEEILHFVQDEASAFCESGDDVLSSAAIALEYKKGNREYVYTIIRGTPDYASIVTEFMRKTLDEGGIAPKDQAKHILLADELFAICCRVCREESDIKLECAIKRDDNQINIRMFAPMDGNDPLKTNENDAGGAAANYIRTHTRRAAFESGIDRDMIEIAADLT